MEKNLKKFGISEYEIDVYTTLLKEGQLTGGMLSKKSKVPHGKTYEAIEKLEEKGFVSIFPSKPKIIKAINPEIALNHFINNKIMEYNELKTEILLQLKNLKKTKSESISSAEKITILKGKKNTLPTIQHFYATSNKYLKILFTYELIPYSSVRLLYEALDRGVKIKQLATKIPEKSKPLMKEMFSKGIEIRYYPVEELRLLIKDGEQCLQQIVNPDNLLDRVSIVIDSKVLTDALETYFDEIWKKAKLIKL
jgi:sugar-specific transcriptional regulator TrmB